VGDVCFALWEVPTFYNKLPNNVKEIENKTQFIRELKKLLI
jgi:hypothetical protein